ncbi:hypothetical protein [Phenylobacterium hankyongense]|uniref:hypothetical protein n=1 Tax=Phenylobacterium hankyongense TaxID=1813876 RepID=UPI001A9E4E25|nr:hypothetical protein [Phenylobacterium hankyongense]
MKKSLAAAMAAITFGGAVAATALPAQAERYEHHGGYDHGGYGRGYEGGRYYGHRDNGGAALAAGVVGLALGAALASSNNHSYGYSNRSYGYNNGYYAPSYGYSGYGYDEPYQVCESRRWVYDPYIGRRVMVRSSYAC